MNQPKFNLSTFLIWIGAVIMALIFLQTVQQQTKSLSVSEFKTLVNDKKIYNNEVVITDESSIDGYIQLPNKEKTPSPKKTDLIPSTQIDNKTPFQVKINATFDKDVVNFLKDNNIKIKYVTTPAWMKNIIFVMIGLTLLLILFSVMSKRMGGGAGGALSFGKSKFQQINPAEIKTDLSQVAGIDDVKSEIEQIVDFLSAPHVYTELGAKIPKGVLLSGPPGTGKTLLAKAIAKEANVPFFSGSGSGFVEMFVGVGASRVRDIFEQARKVAPCIIFIDELDAIGKKRGGFAGGGNDEREQTLNQLLVEMDGFGENSGIIVIAATNRPDVLDSAFTRPGRFDRKIAVGIPNKEGRKDILKIHAEKTRKMPLEDIDFDVIARGTPGFTGAELNNLVNEAALEAAKHKDKKITMKHFEMAKDKLIMGLEQKNLTFSEKEKYNTAIHEAGHTLINVLYKDTLDPIHKVTIVPRGRAAGVTQTLPLDDGSLNYSDDKCNKMIQMLMGGRLAEEVFFKNTKTTGASNDIEKATMIARHMVYSWGMSELGFINFNNDENQYDAKYKFSEATRAEADSIVRKIIDDNYKIARSKVEEFKDAIQALADGLMKNETLDGLEVNEILASYLK